MSVNLRDIFAFSKYNFSAGLFCPPKPEPMISPESDPSLARPLTDAEVQYVFAHLAAFVETEARIDEVVTWPRSNSGLRTDYQIEGIPVLFPDEGAAASPFELGDDGNVVVRHDLVKSAFFLLSAYQEWATPERDEWGRYPYEASIQCKLGMMRRPIVNYYFSWMLDALETQCRVNGVRFARRQPLGGASLHLSHDLDMLHYFAPRRSLYRCAQVLGLRPCDTDRRRLAKAAVKSLANIMRLRHDHNPYWSFDVIQDNEAFLGYKSDWFVLPNDGGPFPPDYDFAHDEDILSLLRQLSERGNRVGLHAPINCRTTEDYLKWSKELREVLPSLSDGCRQHFLAIEPRSSYRAMEEAGLKLDYSYGHSRHEGFRNSYCFPFHPFDHERQRMMNVTCVPLAFMDVTCLDHRKMSYDDIFLAVGEMLDEVRAFGGVFSLLWHNSTFDEVYHPGIGQFYQDLHLFFSQYQLRQFEV